VFLGIPNIFLVMVGEFILLWLVLERTALGRRAYAVGGNVTAAQLRGIPVARIRLLAFTVMGLLAGLGGVLLASYSQTINVSTFQGNYLLDGLTSVFLGAAVLRPGQFHIVGTFVGVLLISTLLVGMTAVGVSYQYESLLEGFVLIVAVGFARLVRT
jgi:ribose transport system permease protein